MLLLAAFTLAHADEISSCNFYPGAAPAQEGDASIGVSATGVTEGEFSVGAGGIDASWAPTKRLGFRVVSHGTGDLSGSGIGTAAVGLVGARYLIVDQPWLRLAPFVALGVAASSETRTALFPAVGASVEAGSDRVWFDGSMPLVVAMVSDEVGNVAPVYALPALVEAGVNVRVGERHVIRVGTASLSLNARYRYEADRWYAGAAVGGVVVPGFETLAVGGGSLEGGVRF